MRSSCVREIVLLRETLLIVVVIDCKKAIKAKKGESYQKKKISKPIRTVANCKW